MTGLKSSLLLADIQSPALACSGKLHPAVSRALRSLLHDAEADPHPRRAEYSVDFLQQGRDLWPIDIFALAVLIRAFFLRSGEILKQGTKWSPHILHWSHVVFLDASHEVIPPSQWTSSIAHFARLRPDSRKHQPRGQVRETPERARCYFPLSGNIVDGLLDHDNRACAVAVLQGLFVFSNAATRSLDSPICMRANRTCITAEEMITALRHVQLPAGLDPALITVHSLKHDATSTLVDKGFSDEAGRLAAGFASTDTVKTYDHCRPRLGAEVSQAMLFEGKPSP